MSEEHKKPGVAFWATVGLVAVLVLYPLSMGPLIWLADHQMLPESAEEPAAVFYFPLIWIVGNSDTAATVYTWYARLWMREPEWTSLHAPTVTTVVVQFDSDGASGVGA